MVHDDAAIRGRKMFNFAHEAEYRCCNLAMHSSSQIGHLSIDAVSAAFSKRLIVGCNEASKRRKAMKVVVLVVLFAASALAQSPVDASSAACGPGNVSFKVKLDESPHALAQPDQGKARAYFFHDSGTDSTLGYPTVKLAMDGAWVGANHGNSYFSLSVEPGEHHLCVTLQSSVVAQRVELAHFTAEARKVYYYRTRLVMSRSIELLELEPIDGDQGKYLVASLPLSVSSPKK
jgi:hypothetical protein